MLPNTLLSETQGSNSQRCAMMIEDTLLEFINTLDTSFKRIIQDTGHPLNITASQAQYIEAIYALENPTISELSEKLGITKASVTVGIHKLVEQGFVLKKQSKKDKRVFHVSLTKSSEKLIQAKQLALGTYGDFIRSVLSKNEAQGFEVIMKKLVQAFHGGV